MTIKRLNLLKANLEMLLQSDGQFTLLHQECLEAVKTLEKVYSEIDGTDDAGDSMLSLYKLLGIDG